MSINNLPHILIRKCEERKGIRITERYLESWCLQRQLSSDLEREYEALVSDFLNTEMAQTSKPVISDEISKAPFNTFPPVNLQRGVVLEIVDVDDISNSALSVLESLTNTIHVRRGVVTNDDQPEIQRGTLHWILSDGTTHIHAMENETIPELSLTTPFGCKIMIKNCQVRRGMLLLDRKSVTVLGGETPEAFNNNMTEELISRLRARLGMTSEGQSSTNTINNTPANNTLDGSTLINPSSTADLDDDFGDMDMNDEMYHALENMEANALRNGNNNDDFDEFMDDDWDDDWDPDLLESVLPPTIPSSNTPTPNTTSNSNNDDNSHSIYKRRAAIDFDDPEEGPSTLSQTSPEKKRQKIKSVRADQLEDLMWGDDDDEDVMALDDSATGQKDEIQVVEDNKDERWSLDKLNTILKKMEKDEPVGPLPDTVIINGTIKKLGQLRVTTTQGFYLVGYLRNPMNENDDRLRILFRNKVVTDLLHGVSYSDLMQKSSTPKGKQTVLKETLGPLQSMLRTKEADIEVDLTLCEEDNEKVLMPLVVSYKPVN